MQVNQQEPELLGDHVDALIKQLKIEFARDDAGTNVKQILQDYLSKKPTDWRKYSFFCDLKYARNLIEITEQFELMVICWKPGQESPIHNHSGQRCWMAILEGDMEEVYYFYDELHQVLREGQRQIHPQGTVGFITDEIALHKVRPANKFSHGITMHLYSKPIPFSSIYCPVTGTVTKRKNGFFTVRGQRVAIDCSDQCYWELYQRLQQIPGLYEKHQPQCKVSLNNLEKIGNTVSMSAPTGCHTAPHFNSYQ
jgi:cysteine dioxygenase